MCVYMCLQVVDDLDLCRQIMDSLTLLRGMHVYCVRVCLRTCLYTTIYNTHMKYTIISCTCIYFHTGSSVRKRLLHSVEEQLHRYAQHTPIQARLRA